MGVGGSRDERGSSDEHASAPSSSSSSSAPARASASSSSLPSDFDAHDVVLNVYRLQAASGGPQLPGFGLWHSGVQVHGVEYSYGAGRSSLSGVQAMRPRTAPEGPYDQCVLIGRTTMSSAEARALADELGNDVFAGNAYDTTRQNCNHFADAFCQRLCGKGIPGWVNRAANTAKFFGVSKPAADAEPKMTEAQATSAVTASRQFSDQRLSLVPALDARRCTCLNAHTTQSLEALVASVTKGVAASKRGPRVARSCLISDADETLLLRLTFAQPVKLREIVIAGPGTFDGKHGAPRGVRVAFHSATIGFENVDSVKWPVQQTLDITRVTTVGDVVPVPIVHASNITVLTIYIDSNHGNAPLTCVTHLDLIGDVLATANMANFKPVRGATGYDNV